MTELVEKEHALFFQAYKRLPLDIARGDGVHLYDRRGKEYLDFFGGLAVNALGYGHPAVLRAIEEQTRKYLHLSNLFVQESQVHLVERLLAMTGFARAFLCNSGTEALEGALKLARLWGHPLGKKLVIGLSNAFHGRTFAALSLTDKEKYRKGYEPFLPDCSTIPFNDVTALRKAANPGLLAVVLEPIQGEGGIVPVSAEFAAALTELRVEHGFLIIADEVQSGVGRTGSFLASGHFGLQPDIVMLAKAIGGGLPLGAILGNARVADAITPGVHGTTFGGNPVSCSAGVAVLRELDSGGLMKNAARIGAMLHRIGTELRRDFPEKVRETRGYGCMIGIDLAVDSQPIADRLLDRGILVNSTAGTVLRLLPPLIVQEEHCVQFEKELRDVLKESA